MAKIARAWRNPSIDRIWARANGSTFSIPPITRLLDRWLAGCAIVVDPFAGASTRGTITNDLNSTYPTTYHLDAVAFCDELQRQGCRADAVLFDPPYSPRQIAETYRAIGQAVGRSQTQNSRLYRRVRDGLDRLLQLGGVAISCGWNAVGFGRRRGYQAEEILLVTHGSAHHDTIVVVERKEERWRR